MTLCPNYQHRICILNKVVLCWIQHSALCSVALHDQRQPWDIVGQEQGTRDLAGFEERWRLRALSSAKAMSGELQGEDSRHRFLNQLACLNPREVDLRSYWPVFGLSADVDSSVC